MENATIATPLGALPVVPATVDQAAAVRELRDDLARWMAQRGIRQWNPGDLPLEWIETFVAQGAVHVVSHDDRLVASVTVVWADPLIWGERPQPAGYIHMLMVDRNFAGHGIGRALLSWAERSILATGRDIARLDCVKAGQPLRAYYEGAGYQFVEYKTFPHIESADETALYEKRLHASQQ